MQITQGNAPEVVQPPAEFVHITRSARALLGWMQPQEAEKAQAGGLMYISPDTRNALHARGQLSRLGSMA